MGKTYKDLVAEIENLGACQLNRSEPKVRMAPGGVSAGKIRVVLTLEREDKKSVTPMRSRRLLNQIKERLAGRMNCTLEKDAAMKYSLYVEELDHP